MLFETLLVTQHGFMILEVRQNFIALKNHNLLTSNVGHLGYFQFPLDLSANLWSIGFVALCTI